MERLNLLGAWVAQAIFVLSILVFVARLLGRSGIEYWLGVALLLTGVPLGYLLFQAPRHQRPALYFLQVALMLAWLVVECLLDYVLKVEFRQVRWAAISYVVLFFAGTGGMIGVASAAGRPWAITSIVLFLVMAVLAFVQRFVTGQ